MIVLSKVIERIQFSMVLIYMAELVG